MREFLAEQYLPADSAQTAARGVGALQRAAEQMTREGTRVQFVRSIFIPDDETCIHHYRADSIEAVQDAASRASLQLDRIAEAITWAPKRRGADKPAPGPKTPTQRK